MKNNVRLPEKMSTLIEIAVGDIEAVEKLPHVRIDMNTWHQPMMTSWNGDVLLDEPKLEYCSVCFGGSVMMNTLGVDDETYYVPSEFSKWNASRLQALDDIRQGDVRDAFEVMYPLEDVPENLEDISVTAYSINPATFKSEMKALAKKLADMGL